MADHNSKHNFFTNYSVQGKAHPRSYMHQLRSNGLVYSFIGIDACLEPGMLLSLDDNFKQFFLSWLEFIYYGSQ